MIVEANTVMVSKEDALAVVKQQMDNNPFDYYVASLTSVYDDGEGSCLIDSIPDIEWLKSTEGKWLFFVDEKPSTNWNHKCSFFYVSSVRSGNETVKITSVSGSSLPISKQCEKGASALSISTAELPQGQYLVSLIINNNVVETVHATKQ